MANICSNKFYITSDDPEIIQKVCDKLNNLFETTLDGEIDFSDEYIIEGFFDSRWIFQPIYLKISLMNLMTHLYT